jgi:hypothetical protein
LGAAKACLVGNQKSYQQNSFRHACSGRLMRLVRLLRAYPGTSSARKHYCALTSKSCFRGKIRKSCQQSSCRHTLQRDQASGEAASSLPLDEFGLDFASTPSLGPRMQKRQFFHLCIFAFFPPFFSPIWSNRKRSDWSEKVFRDAAFSTLIEF